MVGGLAVSVSGFGSSATEAASPARPNIVFILCDDLGYGDVQCYNPAGKIATPNLDRLAAAGMRFTDAHTTSSVCSPTRYSLLTGRYNWRSRLQQGVFGGLSPRLIEPGRLTVAALLKQHGYHTAAIGKWHLGMDWARHPDKPAPERNGIEQSNQVWSVDFTQPIRNGPNSVGFDYYFGISASLDMVPYTFIQNDRVTVVPTVEKVFPMIPGKEGSWTRRGPGAPEFEAADVLPTLTRRSVEYIRQRAAAAKAGQPFFLYLPLNAPHTPVVPTPEWRDRSGLHVYADFVMQTDWSVGQVLTALEQEGLTGNTLIIFTSDNGFAPYVDAASLQGRGHAPSAHWRGYKSDLWEGGHRVPFLARWDGKVQPGSTSSQLISLVDFVASCAELLGVRLPDNAGEDSISFLPVLLGRTDGRLRENLVHHSANGKFAIRQGKWKLCLTPGSGGWSSPRDPEAARQRLPATQLYDMLADPGETTNLQAERPEVVQQLVRLLEQCVAEGRSTPGQRRKNDAAVDLWKSPPGARGSAANAPGKPAPSPSPDRPPTGRPRPSTGSPS
jgi:arylsulfatase A-like enzyme